jgi:hypothetical protein
MTLVQKLNSQGIEYFRKYLVTLKEKPEATPPFKILTDPNYSDAFQDQVKVENLEFESRIHMIRYLSNALGSLTTSPEIQGVGLWSWLSLFYFDLVCPQDLDGKRTPGTDCRHILSFGYRYRYTHLLAEPFQIFKMYGEKGRLLLHGAAHTGTKTLYEIAKRQNFITNSGIIEALDKLYFDCEINKPKAGALSKVKGGSLLRFIDVIQQLELNYDLYSMTAEEIMHLLPEEFSPWKELEPVSN